MDPSLEPSPTGSERRRAIPPSTDGTPSTAYLARAKDFAERVRASMEGAVANDALYHQLAGSPATEAFATTRAREIMEELIATEREGGGDRRAAAGTEDDSGCLLYTSPSPRDATLSRMPSSA